MEKVATLNKQLTTNDKYTNVTIGDIVLYNSNNLFIFYGSNSWSYTKIERIKNIQNLKEALSTKDVDITFSL